MHQTFSIQGATILGAMTSPHSKASFNQGGVVVRSQGAIVQVLAYTSDGKVTGPVLSDAEWSQLVASEHALALPEPVPLTAGTSLWVLRSRLSRRDQALKDLTASGVLLCELIHGEENAWLCLVDESREAASALRDRWRREAFGEAKRLARAELWPRAEHEVEIAFAVARSLDAEVLALMAIIYPRTGRGQRAAGILPMARNSRGEDFAVKVTEHRVRLEREIFNAARGLPPAPLQWVRPPSARAWEMKKRKNQRQALDTFARKDAA